MPSEHPDKVICVGMNKTGTSTMKRCFDALGLTPVSCPSIRSPEIQDLIKKFQDDRDYGPLVEAAAAYRSFEDRPWNMWKMHEHLDERYPGSRFILTVRDPESWWRSTERWIKIEKPHMVRCYLSHLNAATLSKEDMIKGYLEHNESVIRYFEGTDKLLVMKLEDGDGWEKLCRFLNLEIPDAPFPHANRQTYRRRDKHLIETFDPDPETRRRRPKGLRGLWARLKRRRR